MEWLIVILLIANLALLAFLFFRKSGGQDSQGMMMLQNQLEALSRTMDTKLGEGTKTMFEGMQAQSDQSQRLISTISKQVSDQLMEVVKGVSETRESTKQVFTIAEQLQNLEKVLKHQKQ